MNNCLDLDDNYIDATDIDFSEAGHFYTILDAALLIDEMGVVAFLRDITRHMNNPMEQHVATQLCRVAEKYEHILLKMRRADEVLYAVNKDGVGENV
jgi:hypothetical protein